MYTMVDLREIIASYIDLQLEECGHPALRSSKLFRSADRDVFEDVSKLCHRLESDARFSDILESFRKFGVSQETFLVVLDQLLIGELNWARVLSLVALSGTLAVQCAENCEENKIDLIQDWATSFAEVKLGPWIEANDGMEGLRNYFHPSEPHVNQWEKSKLLAVSACGAVGIAFSLFVASRA